MYTDFQRGDLVWFDPGIGYVLPGEVIEFHKQAQVSRSMDYQGPSCCWDRTSVRIGGEAGLTDILGSIVLPHWFKDSGHISQAGGDNQFPNNLPTGNNAPPAGRGN